MRKSNWLVAVLVAVIAVFLVILWYMLGFDKVDAPLDLVLGIIVLLLVLVAIIVLKRMEEKRRNLLRAVYVSAPNGFNTELGPVPATSADVLVEASAETLSRLEYSTDTCKAPEGFEPLFVVETSEFKLEKQSDDATDLPPLRDRVAEWKGVVRNVETDTTVSFDGPDSLEKALASYYA